MAAVPPVPTRGQYLLQEPYDGGSSASLRQVVHVVGQLGVGVGRPLDAVGAGDVLEHG